MRKIFAILLFIPIILIFFAALSLENARQSFLNPETYKDILARNDVYGKADELIARELPKAGKDFFASIPLVNPEDAIRVLRAAFPSFFWKETAEGLLDQFFIWFKSGAKTPVLMISTEKPKKIFAENFEKTINEKLAALPVCSTQNLIALGKKLSENNNNQKAVIVCKPNGINELKDIEKIFPPNTPNFFSFVRDLLKTIPDNINLTAAIYNLELQNLKNKTNSTAIPKIELDQNNQLDFLFKPQIEGGEPSFVKNLREARSVAQTVFSYIVYLWIGLIVLLIIFVLLVLGPIQSMFRWIGALFVAAGGVIFGAIIGIKQFALLFATSAFFKGNNDIIKEIQPLVSNILRDIIDRLFSPLITASAIALVAGLVFLLISTILFYQKKKEAPKRLLR